MALRTLFTRQRLAIAATAGRVVLPPLVILPQTSIIEVRIPRPTTLTPRAFGGAARIKVAIIVTINGEEFRCDGGTTGGIRNSFAGGEIPEYVLRYGLPYGFFDVKSGFPVRLGERAVTSYEARVEITSRDGSIDSEIQVFGFDAPAPLDAFHSSVAFDAATQAEELSGDGVLSWSHTATGANLGVFVGVGNNGATPRAQTSTTYGSTGMNLLWDTVPFGTFNGNAGYNFPGGSTVPTGSQTITNTLNGTGDEHRAGAISMTGVDQTTPAGTPNTATGNSTTATVTVASVGANDMVVASCSGGWLGATPGANETERYDETSPAGTFTAGTTQLGSDGGVMTMTRTAAGFDTNWGIGGVAFKPAAAGGASIVPVLMAQYRRRWA
jgi:hypothetical protein